MAEPPPASPAAAPAPAGSRLDLDALEKAVGTSTALAWLIILGLPLLGAVAVTLAGLPPFVVLLASSFLTATGLVCARAVATFAGKALRLLVAARLVLVLVLGALLFGASGSAWVAVVSALLLWLTADRLLGRRALYDLWNLTRSRP